MRPDGSNAVCALQNLATELSFGMLRVGGMWLCFLATDLRGNGSHAGNGRDEFIRCALPSQSRLPMIDDRKPDLTFRQKLRDNPTIVRTPLSLNVPSWRQKQVGEPPPTLVFQERKH